LTRRKNHRIVLIDMPLSQDEQKQYKALYLQTARQYIKELQDNMSQLHTGNESVDVIDTLHRDVHSIKGQSAMMEFQSMSAISFVMEQIFMKKKEKSLALSPELITKFDEAIKQMEESLNAIDTSNQEKDLSQYTKELRTLANIAE
jgi:chemotaxis protein histidine kinase CheA